MSRRRVLDRRKSDVVVASVLGSRTAPVVRVTRPLGRPGAPQRGFEGSPYRMVAATAAVESRGVNHSVRTVTRCAAMASIPPAGGIEAMLPSSSQRRDRHAAPV